MPRLLLLGLGLVGLVGCGRETFHPTGTRAPELYQVDIERGLEQQPSIRVVRAPAQEADEVLIETQGFVEAWDRFQQMDLLRRSATGRLSEIFGKTALVKDKTSVGVGLRLATERTTERIRREFPQAYRLLEAFARGVNRFLAQAPAQKPRMIQWYQFTTRDRSYLPDPWVPADSVAVGIFMAYYLSSGLNEKIELGRIAADYFERTKRHSFVNLFDWRPIEPVYIMDQGQNARPWEKAPDKGQKKGPPVAAGFPVKEALRSAGECVELGPPFPPCAGKTGIGSNNWVLSPAFTGTGTSILANDPHLALTLPMTMYEVALDSLPAGGTFKVRGYNLPGVPGVLIGHNERIAWGFTNLPADVDEVYIELLDKQGLVLFDQKKVPLEIMPASIRVRTPGGQLVEATDRAGAPLQLRIVPHHGPVFSDLSDDPKMEEGLEELAKHLPPLGLKPVLSYRWTGHAGTAELIAILGLNRAKDFEEFKQALRHLEVGAQNVLFMDRKGNIGYYAHGKYPVRTPRVEWPPYVPQLGIGKMPFVSDSGHSEWKGFRAEMPEIYNPRGGKIITANNDVWGHSGEKNLSDLKDYFGYGFSTGIRASRIQKELDRVRRERGKITVEDVKRLQGDVVDLLAVRSLELVAKAGVARERLSVEAQQVFDSLFDASGNVRFDGKMSSREEQPLVAYAWLRAARDEHFLPVTEKKKRLPQNGLGATVAAKTIYHSIRDRLEKGEIEGARAFLTRTLERAATLMRAEGLANERWGKIHTLQFLNLLDGVLPALVSFPVEYDGSWETVNCAAPGLGPSFRLVMSTTEGRPFEAVTVVPGGNYHVLETEGWRRELFRWLDNEHRPLIEFH